MSDKKGSNDLFKRLTKLFKSGPVVRRKVRNIDTTVALPDRTQSSAVRLFQRSLGPTYSHITGNAYNMQERMSRYLDFNEMEACIHGDTKIATPNGWKTIAELAKECEDNPEHTFIVYAYDHSANKIVPALGKQARQTAVLPAFRVTFDNGKEIIGDATHRLMLRDGSYKRIGELVPGDAMMPFLRRELLDKKTKKGCGYQYIYTIDRTETKSGWRSEHRIIAEFMLGRKLGPDEVVHHVNFIRHDNRPENLCIMSDEEHQKLHLDNVIALNKKKWAPENQEWIEKFKADHSKFMTENNPATRHDITFSLILQWCDKNGFHASKLYEALNVSGTAVRNRLSENGFDSFEAFARAYQPGWTAEQAFTLPLTFQDICKVYSRGKSMVKVAKALGVSQTAVYNRLRKRGYKNWGDFKRRYRNCKVVSVEPVGEMPLYDLTVDGYKNFATDSVISHNTAEINSALDIYCLASDTVIPLLDGTKLTVKELYDAQKINFGVYSFDVEKSDFVPGTCTKVVQTGKHQPIYRVLLDDNTFIRLTSSHLVLLSDNTYCRVADLKAGDSVRSLYTRISSKDRRDRIDGYEQLLLPNGWEYTHRIVAEHCQPENHGVVHHVDFNKRNNEAKNLCFMTWADHQALHAANNSNRWATDVEYAKKMSNLFSKHAKFLHSQPGWTEWFLQRQKETFASYDEKTRKDLFGRPNEQNGMFNNGQVISGNQNGRWNENFVRNVTREQIVTWINSGKTLKEICHSLPMRHKDMAISMRSAGIKKWAKRYVVDGKNLLLDLRSWIESQPSSVNLFRSMKLACEDVGVSQSLVYDALISADYKNWADYVSKTNHLVMDVIFDGYDDVYDLHVPMWHNFAIAGNKETSSYVMVHNSDESVAQDELGKTLHIYSNNPQVKNLLEDLFYNTLNVEFNMRPWCRNLVKYGDFLLYNDVHPNQGVINVIPIPVNEIEREEGYDKEDPMAVRFRWVSLGNKVLENWEVIHMRLLGNDMFLPYGSSVLEGARRIWRQLILIEDAMLVYRIVRSPERRVFYIDVGNTPNDDIPHYLEQAKTTLRSQQVIDKTNGRVDLRYNPLCNSLKTFIKLQDGRTITLGDLIKEWENGKQDQWVYSVDVDGKRIAPGKVTWAGVTRKDAELVRVHLDDGTHLDCTPDHRFMLRDGTYKEAQLLEPDTALMPLYTRLTDKSSGHQIVGYETAYDPFTQSYVSVHRNNVIVTQGFEALKGKVVHHKDFDKRNNNPDNLQPLTRADHHKLHGEQVVLYNKSDVGRRNSSRRMKKTWAEGGINENTFVELWQDPKIRKLRVDKLSLKLDQRFVDHCFSVLDSLGTGLSTREETFLNALNSDQSFVAYLKELNPDFKNGFSDRLTRGSLQSHLKEFGFSKALESLKRSWLESRVDVNQIIEFCNKTPNATRKDVLEKFGINRTNFAWLAIKTCGSESEFSKRYLPGNARYSVAIEKQSRNCSFCGAEFVVLPVSTKKYCSKKCYHGSQVGYKNHKVVCVERLTQREDTGCITVEKYHNFAAGGQNESGKVSDSFVYVHNCFQKLTNVPLLDGRTISIKDLADEWDSGRRDQEVYSLDLEQGGRVVPGKVIWAGKSGVTKQFARVTLDDGGVIEVTPDHKMMLRDGNPIKAKDLQPGQSVMPLYKRYAPCSGEECDIPDRHCYEKVYDPSIDNFSFTHRLIAAFMHGLKVYKSGAVEQQGKTIHHVNFNKLDNSTKNLQIMTNEEHSSYHAILGRENIIKYNKSEKKRKKTSEDNKKYRKAEKMGEMYNGTALHKEHNVQRAEAMHKMWDDPEQRAKAQENMSYHWDDQCQELVISTVKQLDSFMGLDAFIREKLKNNEAFVEHYVNVNSHLARDAKKSIAPHIVGNFIIKNYKNWRSVVAAHNPRALGRKFVNNVKVRENPTNHKVVSVEIIDREEEVYNVTVDKFHNLAVQGINEKNNIQNLVDNIGLIFAFQSVDEDFFIGVRGSESGTKIDTLQGGQNTAAVEDVKYIQNKLFAALKVPKAYLGFDEMLSCLVSTTYVPLLDGRSLTMEQLANEYDQGKQNWVYSTDLLGNVKPGRINKAWATKQVSELYHVTLDNGEIVKCTANHPFLCRDGVYRRADELQPGQSLMPVYRRKSSKEEGDLIENYDMVWQNEQWEYTHKVIYDDVCQGNYTVKKQRVIHHKDCNKHNNNPDNLQEMDWYAHRKWHANNLESTLQRPDVIEKREPIRIAALKSEQHRQKKSKQMTAQHADPTSKMSQWVHGEEISEVFSEKMQGVWERPEYRAIKTKQNKENWKNPEYRAKFSGDNHWLRKKNSQYDLEKIAQVCNESEIYTRKQFLKWKEKPVAWGYVVTLLKQGGYTGWKDFATRWILKNHKVVSIEIVQLVEPVWVYDLEVEKYSNFLVQQGVQVHNSKATLAQEDIRFSRTINMIQRTIISELNKIAIIHLFANGFEGDDLLNFSLKLSNPSTVAQQQKLELFRTKFEIAGTAPEGLLSRDWVRKNVLGLTDEEIVQIERELIEDASSAQAREAAEAAGGGGGGGGGSSGGGGGFGPPPSPSGGPEEGTPGAEGETPGGAETGAPEGGEEEETPPPENAGAEDQTDRELLTSGDDPMDETDDDVPLRLSMKDDTAPVKAQAQLDRTLYNRGRRRTHGASKTHMPDFNKMTGNNNLSMKDPHDTEWMKSIATNPLAEGVSSAGSVRPALSTDVSEMLRKMSERWGRIAQNNGSVSTTLLAESQQIDDLDLIIGEDREDEDKE